MPFFRQLLLICSLVLFISPAFATNGYLAHGYGIKSRGMAGAGVALPQETLSAAINPASIAFIGNRVDISAALFNPRRSYEVTGTPSAQPQSALAPAKVDSGREYFIIPEMGASWQLDDHKSLGLILHGNGGMNTSYAAADTAGGSFSGTTGVDLSQLFYPLPSLIALIMMPQLVYLLFWPINDFQPKDFLTLQAYPIHHKI
jgi:long-chain fatty acid transport protein